MRNIFKKQKYVKLESTKSPSSEPSHDIHIPSGLWVKCSKCNSTMYKRDLEETMYVCGICDNHFRIGARQRIEGLADEGTFNPLFVDLLSENPLEYRGYEEKIEKAQIASKLNEAVEVGECLIGGEKTVIGVMDSNFMMGSMGSVVGEKITKSIEYATKHSLPVILFCASGGARMQEGIFSLMQMAKVSAAIAKHDSEGGLYVSVLTDPTTGGVTASFAMQGDIIIAEPKATIGFAGKRVIQQTIKQKLPEEFQTAEFLLEKGFVDTIVHRRDMKRTLAQILKVHGR